jgi:hydrogenase-4 component F
LLVKAGLASFSQDLLILFGLASMTVAAVFMIRQGDYKRLLAYSSVEHMGILALGVGIGGVAGFGSLLHAINHSLTKVMLFLVAGNTLAYFCTKSTLDVRGVRRLLPVTGALWVGGALAILGSPPFGTFLSELLVLKGLLDSHRVVLAVWYLAALAVAFVAMTAIVIAMVYGEPRPHGAVRETPPDVALLSPRPAREPLWSVAPPVLLGLAVLVLGLYVPQELNDFLHRVALAMGVE